MQRQSTATSGRLKPIFVANLTLEMDPGSGLPFSMTHYIYTVEVIRLTEQRIVVFSEAQVTNAEDLRETTTNHRNVQWV
jgi:hypothetical protein